GSQRPISNAIKEIIANLSKYYGTEENNSTGIVINEYKLPSFVNKKVDTVITSLAAQGIKYNVIGTGSKIIKQYPEKNDIITSKDTVYLITNASDLVIPNVVGLSSK